MKTLKSSAIILLLAITIGLTGNSIKSNAAGTERVLNWDTCSIGESVIDMSNSYTGHFKDIDVTLEYGRAEDGLRRADLFLHGGATIRFTCPEGKFTKVEIVAVNIPEHCGINEGWALTKRVGSTIVGVDESYVLVWTGEPTESVTLSAGELKMEFVTQGLFYVTE